MHTRIVNQQFPLCSLTYNIPDSFHYNTIADLSVLIPHRGQGLYLNFEPHAQCMVYSQVLGILFSNTQFVEDSIPVSVNPEDFSDLCESL